MLLMVFTREDAFYDRTDATVEVAPQCCQRRHVTGEEMFADARGWNSSQKPNLACGTHQRIRMPLYILQ